MPPKKKREINFYVWLRQGLRSLSRKWPPIFTALANAKRPAPAGSPPRQKVAYECAICKGLFPAKQVCVDHIKPAGTLLTEDDIQEFVTTLFCGVDNLQVLCKNSKDGEHIGCHEVKTYYERYGLQSMEEARLHLEVIKMLKNKKQCLAFLSEHGYTGKDVSNDEKRRTLLLKIKKESMRV